MSIPFKADFHSVEFSDWTGHPLFTCEIVALNLNRMLRVTKTLLCQIQFAQKILLSGNQPLNYFSFFPSAILIPYFIVLPLPNSLTECR